MRSSENHDGGWDRNPLGSFGSSKDGGTKYDRCHQTVQTTPMAPVIKKMARQEEIARMPAIIGGATTAPTAVPPLMIPIAVARSLTENHSATARVAAGNPPPSPRPSRNRLAASMAKLIASPWLRHEIDQNSMISVNPRLVPRASESLPPPAYMKA